MPFYFAALHPQRVMRWLTYGFSLITDSANQATSSRPVTMAKRPHILGTTFSQLQCRYLELDYRAAFRQICTLGFDRIRLCCYWNELEPQENQFDFTTLDWLLEECDRHNIAVILAVGMKVPRYPEFHFPDWLSDRYETGRGKTPLDQRSPAVAEHTLRFIEAVVQHTRQAAAIQYWQIENEPFTRLEIAGGRFLSAEFIRQEVELIRQLTPDHKLLLTGSIALPFADAPEDETALQACIAMADAVGINVYSKVPLEQTAYYLEPQPAFWQTLQRWQTQIQQQGKETWIAEAQAEPWEPHQLVATKGIFHPSSSPQQTVDLVQQLVDLDYQNILLWGCEYWYWHQQQGRSFWWDRMQQMLQAER